MLFSDKRYIDRNWQKQHYSVYDNVNLTTKTWTLLSRETTPRNFSELKTILTQNFKCTKTIPMLYTELGNRTQRNTITNFKDKILELTALLKYDEII